MALMPTHCPFKGQQRRMKLCSMPIQITSQHFTFDRYSLQIWCDQYIHNLPPWLLPMETNMRASSLHFELSEVTVIIYCLFDLLEVHMYLSQGVPSLSFFNQIYFKVYLFDASRHIPLDEYTSIAV